MAEIRFSVLAANDLKEIKVYISDELGNEQAAHHIVEKILHRIRTLREFPEIGAPLSAVIKFDTPYRYLVCGNYNVFYHFDHSIVQIERILYNRRNYMQILFGDPSDS